MPQTVTCFECGRAFEAVPSDFIYDDPMAGWHQDPTAEFVNGYCAPCANGIETSREVYGGRGTAAIEQRAIEDEAWIWAR